MAPVRGPGDSAQPRFSGRVSFIFPSSFPMVEAKCGCGRADSLQFFACSPHKHRSMICSACRAIADARDAVGTDRDGNVCVACRDLDAKLDGADACAGCLKPFDLHKVGRLKVICQSCDRIMCNRCAKLRSGLTYAHRQCSDCRGRQKSSATRTPFAPVHEQPTAV